jgi:hypothetical protein
MRCGSWQTIPHFNRQVPWSAWRGREGDHQGRPYRPVDRRGAPRGRPFSCLRTTDETEPRQLVYYDPGIGTLARPDQWHKLKQDFNAILGLATELSRASLHGAFHGGVAFQGTANHVATAACARHGSAYQPMINFVPLNQPGENAVTGTTKPRSWLVSLVLWIIMVAVFLAGFTFINAPGGGSPPWVVSLIVSWLPFVALVGIWLWLSRKSWRGSSGTSWVDLCEQQVIECRRTNALLERIAVALEKPSTD